MAQHVINYTVDTVLTEINVTPTGLAAHAVARVIAPDPAGGPDGPFGPVVGSFDLSIVDAQLPPTIVDALTKIRNRAQAWVDAL
jgi:hypothetical protein